MKNIIDTVLDIKKKIYDIEKKYKEEKLLYKIKNTEKDIILKDLKFFNTNLKEIDNVIYDLYKNDNSLNNFLNKKIKKKHNMSLDDINISDGCSYISKNNMDLVNLGFNNNYFMKSIKNAEKHNLDDLEYNTFVYIKSLEQVIIKVGNPLTPLNYKIVNTKLCKVYNSSKNSLNNTRSIICNNNIKEKSIKCSIYNCNYYHDPFLGYEDNYHVDRQYSNNPIVYNNSNFKSGDQVKENIKKIKWHEAITLYQASLMNLLISCLHASQT
jgi:hypothetical protein